MEILVTFFCLTTKGLSFLSAVHIYIINGSANLHIPKPGFFLLVAYSLIIRPVPTGGWKAETYWPSHG